MHRTTCFVLSFILIPLAIGRLVIADATTQEASTQPATQPAYPPAILPGYTADPDIHVFGDTYYIYPTSDKDQWKTTDFSAFSSQDLIHWKDDGIILDVTKDLKWGNLYAWAPGMAFRDGTYFFYFCANQKIGVATSDKPTGPFTDVLGKPLIVRTKQYPAQVIDPYPFIDDDGQAYLLYGQGNLWVEKLNKDMISFDGPPVKVTPKGYNEGSYLIKRKGIYYFMWSENDARSDDYRIAYGMSKSPLGPIDLPPNNVILKKSGIVKGTGHHSVIQVPGTDRWYICYHRHAIPNGNGYTRETCLDRMEFNDDGTIKPVDPLQPAFPPGSPGEPLTGNPPHGLP